jgi:hypothetical protein
MSGVVIAVNDVKANILGWKHRSTQSTSQGASCGCDLDLRFRDLRQGRRFIEPVRY